MSRDLQITSRCEPQAVSFPVFSYKSTLSINRSCIQSIKSITQQNNTPLFSINSVNRWVPTERRRAPTRARFQCSWHLLARATAWLWTAGREAAMKAALRARSVR